MTDRTRVIAHDVHRLELAVDLAFDEFRGRYEQAVPMFDPRRFGELMMNESDWDLVRQTTVEEAPHGFLLYWRSEIDQMMRLAGHSRRCVTYLMGNHTIAERMYRHDAGVMLYAPLRTTLYEDDNAAVWFSVDLPSTHFSSFSNTEIAAIGDELDGKLAILLASLGVPLPAGLAA